MASAVADLPKGSTPAINRRRHARVRCEESPWMHMRLRTGDILSIVNISVGGALVDSYRQLSPGLRISVHLRGAEREMRLEALVVRCWVWAIEHGGRVRYRGALEFEGESRDRLSSSG